MPSLVSHQKRREMEMKNLGGREEPEVLDWD